jgi:hypothetical protein
VAVVAVMVAGWMCASAQATSSTGHQNPDLIVTATVTPSHVQLGDVVHGVAKVTNVSSGKVRVNFIATFETGKTFEGAGLSGRLEPGKTVKLKFDRVMTSDELGTITLKVRAGDKNGRSSVKTVVIPS